jgi:hypothetical protein
MLRLLVLCSALVACNRDRPLANAHCETSIAEYCANGYCPESLSDWCAGGQLSQFYGWNGATTCNGWSYVTQPSGDQARDYFYDSTGKLVAVMGSVSNPPCEGSCLYVCMAGPSDVSTADVDSCNHEPSNQCGEYTIVETDGGIALTPSDGGVH